MILQRVTIFPHYHSNSWVLQRVTDKMQAHNRLNTKCWLSTNQREHFSPILASTKREEQLSVHLQRFSQTINTSKEFLCKKKKKKKVTQLIRINPKTIWKKNFSRHHLGNAQKSNHPDPGPIFTYCNRNNPVCNIVETALLSWTDLGIKLSVISTNGLVYIWFYNLYVQTWQRFCWMLIYTVSVLQQ